MRHRYSTAGAVVVLVALGCLVCGCSRASPRDGATATASPAGSRALVALGDSVPRGTNCACDPYPQLTADRLAAGGRQPVSATNDAVAGATSSDVLEQLTSDTGVIDHVRAADAVEIEVGANDVAYSKSCGTAVECYAARMPAIEKNLAAIVEHTRQLTSGHKTVIVLLDYWSVWLGGQYAAEQGDAYVGAAERVTADVNALIKSTADESGSAYVDLRAAFKGPDYAYDETHYLASDGDHPNRAGHEQIAAAATTIIEKTLGF